MNLDDWPSIKFFSYRDGPCVFVVEELTGLAVCFGLTLPQARHEARRVLAEKTAKQIRADLDGDFAKINPGPKPVVEIKV